MLGHDRVVESICTGGFTLDVPFTATGLRELAKMDGAIIIDRDITRITRAAVHLMPDPSIPSEETGTRHRTADRVARQTGFPVISVSQSMQIIAAYVGEIRHVIEGSAQILSRANQALATLERYKLRLDEVSATLSALEIEDLVTVRDVAVVAQRLEMVIRIAREIEDYVLELGTDGRLLSLQLEELVTGVDQERELVVRDYLPSGRRSKGPEAALARLEALSSIDLVDPASAARALGARRAPRRRGRPARLPPAGQGAAAARRRSSSGWSSTSTPCRSCCRPASTTSRPSTAWASCGPAACARACRAWRSRRSSSATSEPAAAQSRLPPSAGSVLVLPVVPWCGWAVWVTSAGVGAVEQEGHVLRLAGQRRDVQVVGARQRPLGLHAGSPARSAGRSRSASPGSGRPGAARGPASGSPAAHCDGGPDQVGAGGDLQGQRLAARGSTCRPGVFRLEMSSTSVMSPPGDGLRHRRA